MRTGIETTIAKIGPLDEAAAAAARARQDELTKPRGSLGRLEDLSVLMAGVQGTARPRLTDKAVVVFAADHGVTAKGVAPYPKEVTAQMVLNFLAGGAGINVLARHTGTRVTVVDMGIATDYPERPGLIVKRIGRGTANIAEGPAMTRAQAEEALEAGIDVVEAESRKGLDILGIGEMGIGNTTPSAAIVAAFTGLPAEAVTGRGAGVDDAGLARKVAAVKKSLETNRPDPADPITLLSKIGGFEIGGMAGAILAAAAMRVPVVVDGFIAAAAALIAAAVAPAVKPYLIASHRSAELGHAKALEKLGLEPLLHLGLRLGEGTGAALAVSLVEASVKVLNEMATFGEAGVAGAGEGTA